MINSLGRELPEAIGDYKVRPYENAWAQHPATGNCIATNRRIAASPFGKSKVAPSLRDAVAASGLRDGMTISFHHCFREGDMVIGQVLTAIRELGIKNLKFAPSAVVNIKEPSLVRFVQDGTISAIEASGIRGELGNAAINGEIKLPIILRSHGSRPRAIEAGELRIDVAFIGASAADEYGNATGQIGTNACGSLGYAFIDAVSAEKVVIVTDTIVDFPCTPASISQQHVDIVAVVDRVGNTEKIGAGAARLTRNPRDLLIAERVADVISASSRFGNGFSFQTGAGAISIACTAFLSDRMSARGVNASFALGGITSGIVDMYKLGQVRVLECSQSFDSVAARAIVENSNIIEIDNALYSNPYSKGSLIDRLNFAVLGALEVDTDFNVNILTGSSGQMLGGLGGGPDVAAGADIPIIALPIVRGRTPSIVKRVFTMCTPGETVAAIVTEAGIALNPKHRFYQELACDLRAAGIKTVEICELQRLAESLTGVPKQIECRDDIACIVEYRDGSVIDVIRQLA